MSLISIQIKDIPDYLKTSDFYNNLDVNEYKYKNKNDTITIPFINFKKDCKIRNFDELMNLLHTLRFWMVHMEDFYCGIFDFVKMCNDVRYKYLYEEFYDMDIINDIKYLHQIYFIERKSVPVILTDDNFDKVCELGLLYLLKYFHKNRMIICNNDNMPYNCIQYGNSECLKYLHSNGFHIDENLINTCCLYGKIDCLKYLHKNGFTIDEGCVNSSVKSNSLCCLKFCLKNGGELTNTSYMYLSENKKNININVNPIMNYIDENYNYNEVIKKEQELRKQLNSNIGYDDFDY